METRGHKEPGFLGFWGMEIQILVLAKRDAGTI